MKLTFKVILIVVLTVTTIISTSFYILAKHFDQQVEQHLLVTARTLYENIVIVRKWVSDNNGVLIKKRPGMQSNPYLPHPDLITEDGDTLTLKNPALVTRELSELSLTIGRDFSFHLSSLDFINPTNKPDDFETEALLYFHDTTHANTDNEFYHREIKNGQHFFRYFAPLYTEQSCLSCHAGHGYRLGDLRGGMGIILATDLYEEAKKANLVFFIFSGSTTILILTFLLFIAIQRSVIKPLKIIENSAQKIREGTYDVDLKINKRDEIGSLAITFEEMRKKIKSYTEQLINSERKYRNLIEHSIEAVIIIDTMDQIIECNSKLLTLTGYDREELRSFKFKRLIDYEDRNVISHVGTSENFETILHTKFTLNVPVEVNILKGFSLGSQENLSFIYIRDLSERKKIEDYSIQTEKMYALGQVSSGIAHEIRNPLFALKNNLAYLNRKHGDNTDYQEIYIESRYSIDRIENLINGILDYAKPHKISFSDIDIRLIIEKCLVLVQKQFEKSSIKIEFEFGHGNQLIEADAHLLEQVFLNLILNAFQAMENAGILIINTSSSDQYVIVSIKDTGKGIPDEEIDRIFEPFYSKFSNGTGLGLAISQRILSQHNAQYHVESSQGLGTTFILSFPHKQG
jgi:PAS domain S-box-containing protein